MLDYAAILCFVDKNGTRPNAGTPRKPLFFYLFPLSYSRRIVPDGRRCDVQQRSKFIVAEVEFLEDEEQLVFWFKLPVAVHHHIVFSEKV